MSTRREPAHMRAALNAPCEQSTRRRDAMTISVECYAGYRGEQEPIAFSLGARRLVVRTTAGFPVFAKELGAKWRVPSPACGRGSG